MPSHHGERESSSDFIEDTNRTEISVPGYSFLVNPKPPVRYTHVALTKVVTTDDEPKLPIALKYTGRNLWLNPIHEESNFLEKNGTLDVRGNPPANAKVLPSVISIRIKS